MRLATGTAALVIALASVYSTPANAVVESHTLSANAASRCQGALPSFDTSLRKRPLAVQNEGTTNAFVSCAFDVEFPQNAAGNVGTPGSYSLSTWYFNGTAAPITVTCTAVSGFQTGTNVFVSKTTGSIPAGAQGQLFWDETTDFPDGFEGLIAISCNLPPGTGINDTYINWDEVDNDTPPAP